MGFKFAKSEIELTYQGVPYTLKVDVRVAVDLERHMNMHPLTLAIEINKCATDGKIPPLGQMAEFFEFMLQRAGCPNVDFEEVYSAMYDTDDTDGVAESIGEMLGLFMPQIDEVETKGPKPKATPKKRSSKSR
jgi:hypothetical protein